MYFLLQVVAPNIRPLNPEKGSKIVSKLLRYFLIKRSAKFGLNTETFGAILATVKPCNTARDVHFPTYFSLFKAVFLIIFLSCQA